MDRLPIIYVRGYAGSTAGIDEQVDDPFYGFNKGATHVRVGGDGDPHFYQFEGPMLRLVTQEGYALAVHGDQHAYLERAAPHSQPAASLWVYRFYDQAATTFVPQPHQGLLEGLYGKLHRRITADGFDIEQAAAGLLDLIDLVLAKTVDAQRVILVAHSMGGLVARCMMQKVCVERKRPARDLVDKFFTYGTPHGGITFRFGGLTWVEEAFGPNGSDIFAPEKMYGYLTAGARFGDVPKDEAAWDPQSLGGALDSQDAFCLVGTDPKDYGAPRMVVGPKSDGLVMIDHAYLRGSPRAFVYKSHSGPYGEVNSEEGYQNLRRFLFGRWKVQIDLRGLPDEVPVDPASGRAWSWQADTRLSVRGLPVVLSEQQAAHYCPIQLNDELLKRAGKGGETDSPDVPVPFLVTFLVDPGADGRAELTPAEPPPPHEGRARYSLTIRVGHLVEDADGLDLRQHLEQTWDWADSLVVDVAARSDGAGLAAWSAWNSHLMGSPEMFDPITEGLAGRAAPMSEVGAGPPTGCRIELPEDAKALPVLGERAYLLMTVVDRDASVPEAVG